MKDEMGEGEKVHFLTEGIYRNLLDNFNPGIKQLIATGRAFQKALHNVASSSKTYIDSIYTLAQGAQLCKGATSDIGAALLQIAEVHKEINTQVIDNIKSFHAELLIPLETKQEGEMKQINMLHKKYLAGHKYHCGPLEKSQAALRKQRKKSKAAKYGFDQKEYQISRDVKECQARLDEYRVQSLRQSLLEERKRYCFLLDRICAMVHNYASHHSKAQELFTHRLTEWSDLCRHPHVLPNSTEGIIQSFRVQQDEVYTSPAEDNNSGNTDFDRQQSDPERTSLAYGHSGPPSLTYGTSNGLYKSGEEDPYATRAAMAVPNPPRHSRPRVRALFSHEAHGETQLSFVEGDILALIGEQRQGWHYGENLATHRMGWLPIAFTQPIQGARGMGQRVHSLSNLVDNHHHDSDGNDNHHLSEGEGTLKRSNTATDRERPKSLYNARASIPNIQSGATEENKMSQSRSATWDSLTSGPVQRPLPSRPDTMPYNHHLHGLQKHILQQHALAKYPGSVPDVSLLPQESPYSLPPPNSMPPMPPPPPPPPPSDTMPPPPPRPPVPHQHSSPHIMTSQGHGNPEYGHVGQYMSQPPPLPPSHGPPSASSSGYSGSSNRAHQSSNSGSHYSLYVPASNFPPPPPGLAPPPPPPTSDYEEEVPSNPFKNVQLKKASTNDRSAPKIY